MGLRAHQIASDKYSQKYVLNEYNKYFKGLSTISVGFI